MLTFRQCIRIVRHIRNQLKSLLSLYFYTITEFSVSLITLGKEIINDSSYRKPTKATCRKNSGVQEQVFSKAGRRQETRRHAWHFPTIAHQLASRNSPALGNAVGEAGRDIQSFHTGIVLTSLCKTQIKSAGSDHRHDEIPCGSEKQGKKYVYRTEKAEYYI